MSDGGSVGINFNGAVNLNSISGSCIGCTGFTPTIFSSGGAGNEDGFGSFNFREDAGSGFPEASSLITLTVTKNSGTWSSVADVLTPNASGFEVAAHIFATLNPAIESQGAINTGFGTDGPVASSVPEPSTWAMMLLGFAGLGFAFRQSRRKIAFA
jgi:hypothetical protein